MKKYFAFFRLRFTTGLQYRTAAVAGVITQFAWGFMQIMIYKAFYEADSSAFPMTFSATATYTWLQQAFLALFAAWMVESEIFDSIINGNISYELCRPIRIYDMWFSRSLANRISKTVLRCVPILVFAVFLPYPYGIAAPASVFHFFIFLITLFLGLMVTVAFFMLIYGLTFFTISPQGLQIMFTSMVEFFSGAVIPLPFFPEDLQKVMDLLPFASMQNVALRIYSGSMTFEQMRKTIFLQIFWCATLILIGYLLCRYAEKKLTLQGG